MPVPEGTIVANKEQLSRYITRLDYPVVLKPLQSSKGRDIHIGITTWDELERAFDDLETSHGVLIERHITGPEFRLLVVDGRCIAVARRDPAFVIGDGQSTVEALIAKLNRDDPERGLPFERLRERVVVTNTTVKTLAHQKLSLSDVPKRGKHVVLTPLSNISQGGVSVDVTAITHPDNIALAERCAQLVGLDICGVDFICPDITRSHTEQLTAVLELNIAPGLRPHLGANPSNDVAAAIIASRFPAGQVGRVPTVAVTGSVGKTTTVQLTAHILTTRYACVARSTTQGAWIGSYRLRKGDVAGGKQAKLLLQDPTVDAGVFELARGGLLRGGTHFDHVDVGILLNVYDNHLGLDGVNSREQLLRVKRQVIDIARQCVILNADDPLCLQTMSDLRAPMIALISLRSDCSALLDHRNCGGWAAWLDTDDHIVVAHGANTVLSVSLEACPISLNGAFKGVALNVMAAALAALAVGVEPDQILAALQTFEANQHANEKRNVLTRGHPFTLLESHADGAVPIAQLPSIARAHANGRCRFVLCSAGNRPDDFIVQMGVAAQGFDDYVITECPLGLRGREPREAPELLKKGLLAAGVPESRIRFIASPDDALATAKQGLEADDCLCHNLF